jgi:hypothetical protein
VRPVTISVQQDSTVVVIAVEFVAVAVREYLNALKLPSGIKTVSTASAFPLFVRLDVTVAEPGVTQVSEALEEKESPTTADLGAPPTQAGA